MKETEKIITGLLTLAVLGYGGWSLFEQGKKQGIEVGRKQVKVKTVTDFPEYVQAKARILDLESDVDRLKADNIRLESKANSPSYAPSNSISCTSRTIGSSTFTDCY